MITSQGGEGKVTVDISILLCLAFILFSFFLPTLELLQYKLTALSG